MKHVGINEVTGRNEYQFMGELLSVAKEPIKNVNNTEYRPCSIKFMAPNGNEVTSRALMYEKNFQHGVEVGEEYLCTATTDADAEKGKEVLITVSHLQSTSETADISIFESITEEIPA